MDMHERLTVRPHGAIWTTLAVIVFVGLGMGGEAAAAGRAARAPKASPLAADASGLYNVSLLELGATAKGSGAPFNKDWPANNALGGRGTLFGSPLKGGRVDIRLVVPAEIKAIEVTGLDYHGTLQPKAVDIFVEDKMVKHADLPETPGKPIRIDLDAAVKGQWVGIKVTDEYPVRALPGPRRSS